MTCWLNLGQMIKMNTKKFPKNIALKEKDRSLTYSELNKRINKLSHSLLSLGLKKGDKFAVLLENSIEIVEAYLAAAKTGLIIVPVHFRFLPPLLDGCIGRQHDYRAQTAAGEDVEGG